MSVYLVTCRQAGAVKIGCSADPHGRLPEIQWGCPMLLRLEAVLPGNYKDEKALHASFADKRIRGEWFHLIPEIEELITANPPPPAPKPIKITREEDRAAIIARRKWEAQNREKVQEREDRRAVEGYARWIKSCEASGDIHFPFRATEDA